MLWAGAILMALSETATLARVEPFWSWNTPIAWTGFILFADSLVFRARGDSWIRSAPAEFAVLTLLSVPLWLVFEFFNQYIDNWTYDGLPENRWLRLLGYGWAFATIWPAVLEGAELIAVWRGKPRLREVEASRARPARPGTLWGLVLVGALMLAAPFLASPPAARYLAAPVWLGFIFLLDPINARLGEPSLLVDFRARRFDRLLNLTASGLLCGGLWEFWNYWSRAKWHYTVPIMERFKIFEMPIPGYLGFPAFALECFTMYVFVRWALRRIAGVNRLFAYPRGRAIGW